MRTTSRTGVLPAKLMIVATVLCVGFFTRVCVAADNDKRPTGSCTQFDTSWSDTDRAAWTALCEKGDTRGLVKDGNEIARSVIDADFVKMILTRKRYSDALRNGGWTLRGVKVAGSLEIAHGTIPGDITFNDVEFEGPVIVNSHVDGALVFASTKFDRNLDLSGSHINGNVQFDNVSFGKPAELLAVGAAVSGQVVVTDSNLPSTDLSGSNVSLLYIARGEIQRLKLDDATVTGSVFLVCDTNTTSSAHRQCETSGISAQGAQISRDFVISRYGIAHKLLLQNISVGNVFALVSTVGSVDATNSKFGELLLRSEAPGADQEPDGTYGGVTVWRDDSSLDLTNAHISWLAVPEKPVAWPRTINFKSTTFDTLLGDPVESNELMSKEWIPILLRRSPDSIFSFQPYKTFSDYLDKLGDQDGAAAVGMAGKEREWKQAWNNGAYSHFIYLTFSKYMVGFGYSMWRSVGWVVFFVILGAYVFRRTAESRTFGMPLGYAYSFDMFLPLIKLRECHYKIDIGSYARYYFYFHKLAGWVIGSFIVAGLGGFTK